MCLCFVPLFFKSLWVLSHVSISIQAKQSQNVQFYVNTQHKNGAQAVSLLLAVTSTCSQRKADRVISFLPLILVRGSLLQFHSSLWEAIKDKYSFRCWET